MENWNIRMQRIILFFISVIFISTAEAQSSVKTNYNNALSKEAKDVYVDKAGGFILLPAMTNAGNPPEIPDGWSDGYVYANGIRIHYYHAVPAPGKPVIVMVHGVTDIGLSWTTLTWKLQDSYDIYMVDARGHGLSDPFTAADDGNTLV